jgi:hypothetical protein
MSSTVAAPETAAALFMAACEAQGVTQCMVRDPAVKMMSRARNAHWSYQTGGRCSWYANKEIDIQALPAVGPVRFLGALTNGLIGSTNFGASDYYIEKPAQPDYLDGSCPDAEKHWNRTLQAATDEGVAPYAEVYVDDSGKPVALRKGRGAAPTAYLLEPVQMGGGKRKMTYYPGMLVHLRATDDDTRLNRFAAEDHRLKVPPAGAVRPWSDVVGLSPIRLTPLGYDNPSFVAHEEHGELITVPKPHAAAHMLAQRIIEHS